MKIVQNVTQIAMEKNIVMNVVILIKLMKKNVHYVQILKAVKIVISKMERNIVININMDII